MFDSRPTRSCFTSSGPYPVHCSQIPILLLHGFLATPRTVGALAARLGRSGYCTHCIDFGGLFGRYNAQPVEELAHIVAERVDQLVRDHPRERIVLGHSLGGLIGRYYVQSLDGADRVRHLVTLGSTCPTRYPK